MKTSFVVLILALVAIAVCEQAEEGGKLTPDQVVEKLSAKYGEGTCIPLGCKQSCWAGGHKSGFCSNNVCTCIL